MASGTRVGSYEIIRALAEGGMGAVYEVEHRVTRQRRALKVVRPELARREDFRVRFVREVTIASSVRHPNLVETQDPIEDGGMLALPMELLVGETLSARLKRGRLSVAETIEIIVPCCRAVHEVHAKGVIHRDLKPLNIFLAKHGERIVPKVLDFGAAREIDDDEHTRTGLVIGSPFYMAPEQAEGSKDLDIRVDVYALGVITYFCLTGRHLYETDSAQSAVARLLRAEKYPRPIDIDARLPQGADEAVMKALAYDRENRWPSLLLLADALASCDRPSIGKGRSLPQSSEATLLHEATSPSAEPSSVRPRTSGAFQAPPPAAPAARRAPRIALGAVVLIGSALLASWLVLGRRSPPPSTTVTRSTAPDSSEPAPGTPPQAPLASEIVPHDEVPAAGPAPAHAPPAPATPLPPAVDDSLAALSSVPAGPPPPSSARRARQQDLPRDTASAPHAPAHPHRPAASTGAAPCGIESGIPCID